MDRYKNIRVFISISLIGFLFVLTSSFSNNDAGVDPTEYIAVYNSNKSNFEKQEVGVDAIYSVKVIPKELRLIALNRKGNLDESVYKEFKKDSKDYTEFLLQIEIKKGGIQFLDFASDENISYEEQLKYYAFGMQSDIELIIDGNLSHKCTDFVFERNFGATPKASFTIGFSDVDKFETIDIVIKNKMMGNEKITFRFTQKDLKILPTLKSYKKWKK